MANDVSIGTENANLGNRQFQQVLLAKRLAQQNFRPKHGLRGIVHEDLPRSALVRSHFVLCYERFFEGRPFVHAAASISSPAAFHSGNPSSSLRTLYPWARKLATASKDRTQ